MSKKLKKVLSGFLALSMLATPVLSVNAEVVENVLPIEKPEILYGDINGDGVVDNSDVDILKKAIFGIGSLTEFEFYCADLNGDGSVDSFDLTKISKLVKEKRNLRVIENCEDSELISNESSSIYAYTYGRDIFYINCHDYTLDDKGKIAQYLFKPYLYLNGARHYIPTALEKGIVTIDEIMAVKENIRILTYSYFHFDLSFVKVIPPADDVIILPAVEYLYNDGKYDYYFNNILSGLYTIEMLDKQYTLREVIDNQLLTPGEMVSLGLFDYKVSAPFEKIEKIEILDVYDNIDNYFIMIPDAFQLIYQDEEHSYYLPGLYGEYVSVTINGVKFSLKEVIQNEILTIHELIDAGLNASVGYAYGDNFRL